MVKRKNAKQTPPAHTEEPIATNSSSQRNAKPWLMISAALGVALFFVVYLMRLDKVVGMFQDDAWYVLLGKSLATGQGYTLVNSPTAGILPLYPPAFPFLLSLAFRIAPQFPQNLWLLKSVSIAAMLLTGAACYVYFTRYRNLPRHLALAIGAVVALNPGLVFMATSSVLSECAFALAQMAALIAVERCAQSKDEGKFWLFALLAAAACSWAFLTRSMAAGLILAALIYLAKARLFKSAAIFAAGVGLLAGGWTIYTRVKAPTPEQRAEVNNYIVRPYTEQFWDRVAGHESAGSISLGDLPERLWNNFSSMASGDLGGIVTPSFFPSLNQGMAERGDVLQLLLSLIVFGLIVAGFVSVVRERLTFAELGLALSVLIITIWPFPPYRFLLPSLPLLLFYFLMGAKLVFGLHRRMTQTKETDAEIPWTGLTVLAGVLVALNLYGNFSYISRKQTDVVSQRPRWIRVFEENEANMKWAAENVSKSDAIVTSNPALVHLYTGNKTTTFDNPSANWERWNRLGVRYLLHISPLRIPDPDPSESRFRVLHRESELNLRVVDFGPAGTRPNWGAVAPSGTRIN